MAYYKIDKKKFARMRKEAQMFQNDIVCAVGTDFMKTIAEAENRMIFDILNGLESEATAEIEELQKMQQVMKAEAIKEFAERLKKECSASFWEIRQYVSTEDIDRIAEEMAGDK